MVISVRAESLHLLCARAAIVVALSGLARDGLSQEPPASGARDRALEERFFREYPPAVERLKAAVAQFRATGKFREWSAGRQDPWDGQLTFYLAGDKLRFHRRATGKDYSKNNAILITPTFAARVDDPLLPLARVADTGAVASKQTEIETAIYCARFVKATYAEDGIVVLDDIRNGVIAIDSLARHAEHPEWVTAHVRIFSKAPEADGPAWDAHAKGEISFCPTQDWAIRQIRLATAAPHEYTSRVDIGVTHLAGAGYCASSYDCVFQGTGKCNYREQFQYRVTSAEAAPTPDSEFELTALGIRPLERSRWFWPVTAGVTVVCLPPMFLFLLQRRENRRRAAAVQPLQDSAMSEVPAKLRTYRSFMFRYGRVALAIVLLVVVVCGLGAHCFYGSVWAIDSLLRWDDVRVVPTSRVLGAVAADTPMRAPCEIVNASSKPILLVDGGSACTRARCEGLPGRLEPWTRATFDVVLNPAGLYGRHTLTATVRTTSSRTPVLPLDIECVVRADSISRGVKAGCWPEGANLDHLVRIDDVPGTALARIESVSLPGWTVRCVKKEATSVTLQVRGKTPSLEAGAGSQGLMMSFDLCFTAEDVRRVKATLVALLVKRWQVPEAISVNPLCSRHGTAVFSVLHFSAGSSSRKPRVEVAAVSPGLRATVLGAGGASPRGSYTHASNVEVALGDRIAPAPAAAQYVELRLVAENADVQTVRIPVLVAGFLK